MKNPFKHIRNWIKGELRKVGSLLEAISRLQAIEVQKKNTTKKVQEDKVTSSKLGSGGFTMAGFMKGPQAKANEQ